MISSVIDIVTINIMFYFASLHYVIQKKIDISLTFTCNFLKESVTFYLHIPNIDSIPNNYKSTTKYNTFLQIIFVFNIIFVNNMVIQVFDVSYYKLRCFFIKF